MTFIYQSKVELWKFLSTTKNKYKKAKEKDTISNKKEIKPIHNASSPNTLDIVNWGQKTPES